MTYRLIDLTWVQLSRLLLLFRRAEAVEIADGRERWAILIHGRGYTRLLQDDVFPHGPGAFGPGYPQRGPRTFPNRTTAENFMRHVGLLPRTTGWALAER